MSRQSDWVARQMRQAGVVVSGIPQCGTCAHGSPNGLLIRCNHGVDDATLGTPEASKANAIWAVRKYSTIGILAAKFGQPIDGADCDAMPPTDGQFCLQWKER